MNQTTIAVDVGGTKIAAALFQAGSMLAHRKASSVVHQDIAALPQAILQLTADWQADADQYAIATTGQVSPSHVNFLSAKQQLPLQQLLQEATAKPVVLLNDAAAAAWAEFQLLKQQHTFRNCHEHLVYITLSTGVGGGLVQHGQLLTCDDGFCAHLGHTSVACGGFTTLCHCGRQNCVEAIASGTAIARQASAVLRQQVSCEQVFQHYMHLPQVQLIVHRAAMAVAELIANARAWSGTQHVVLGGSVGQSEFMFQLVTEELARLPAIFRPTLLRAQSGADADLWGAYWYSQQF